MKGRKLLEADEQTLIEMEVPLERLRQISARRKKYCDVLRKKEEESCSRRWWSLHSLLSSLLRS
ncbi:hypothetical protein LCGC14_1653390 [marine sediment metagenome]|uniref:Uncharacterized protein n=1 Tax=marine sediment metagenome TaxID=412755 RepID=A0A0F9IIS3_9ZZZZ